MLAVKEKWKMCYNFAPAPSVIIGMHLCIGIRPCLYVADHVLQYAIHSATMGWTYASVLFLTKMWLERLGNSG